MKKAIKKISLKKPTAKKVKNHKRKPKPIGAKSTVNLEVTVCLLDVYEDGVIGSAAWDVFFAVRGSITPGTSKNIWRQHEVSDDCTNDGNRGPNGGKDYCRNILYKNPKATQKITLDVQESLIVTISGTYKPSHAIKPTVFDFPAGDWGVQGNGHTFAGYLLNRLGGFNKKTEYYVFVSVRILP